MVIISVVTMTTMTMIMFPLEMASSLVGSGPELADAAFQPESGGNCHHCHRCCHQHTSIIIIVIVFVIAIVIIIIVVVITIIMITDH